MEGKHISRVVNPLALIAIFAGITQTTSVAVLPWLTEANQARFVQFVVTFPFALVGAFFFFLWFRAGSFYSPKEYRDDKSFLAAIGSTRTTVVIERAIQKATDAGKAIPNTVWREVLEITKMEDVVFAALEKRFTGQFGGPLVNNVTVGDVLFDAGAAAGAGQPMTVMDIVVLPTSVSAKDAASKVSNFGSKLRQAFDGQPLPRSVIVFASRAVEMTLRLDADDFGRYNIEILYFDLDKGVFMDAKERAAAYG